MREGGKVILKKLRLQRGWSQEQLAELAQVSPRTIQRIEKGHKPGLETAKALSSLFEVDLSTFTKEDSTMNTDEDKAVARVTREEEEAFKYASGIKEFYEHLIIYIIFVAFFIVMAISGRAEEKGFFLLFATLGWSVGVALHGLIAFEKISVPGLGPRWERALVEKRLGRKI